jgi:L-ornithine Nalpha-acyltransferase
MSPINCRIAESRKEIDDALRIRYLVFAQELENIDPVRHAIPREVDSFDMLETTIHFVAYLNGAPVGAARMLTPNVEIARVTNTLYGFDLESKFDLTNLARPNIQPAETMRYCVLASARKKPVAGVMIREAVRISRRLGITHWLGSATLETTTHETAARIESVGATLGFAHRDIRIAPRTMTCPSNDIRQHFLNTSACRLSQSPPSNVEFPRVLTMYARRLGARMIGPPLYDARFRGYSIPILMAMADQRLIDDRCTSSPTSSPRAA